MGLSIANLVLLTLMVTVNANWSVQGEFADANCQTVLDALISTSQSQPCSLSPGSCSASGNTFFLGGRCVPNVNNSFASVATARVVRTWAFIGNCSGTFSSISVRASGGCAPAGNSWRFYTCSTSASNSSLYSNNQCTGQPTSSSSGTLTGQCTSSGVASSISECTSFTGSNTGNSLSASCIVIAFCVAILTLL